MAENPLLPNAELRALLALTKRCVALDAAATRNRKPSRAAGPLPAREALIAGTALQLKPGDLLLPERDDATLTQLAKERQDAGDDSANLLPTSARPSSRLMLAAAMAAALRAANTEHLVVVYTHHRAIEPDWESALAWAQERLLPLIVVCADPRDQNAFTADPRAPRDAFTWQAVATSTRRSKLPVLTLEGEDAVAVYRAMQESALRARAGGGPAVLWAMLPSPAQASKRSRSAHPLSRLEKYMRVRKIPLS